MVKEILQFIKTKILWFLIGGVALASGVGIESNIYTSECDINSQKIVSIERELPQLRVGLFGRELNYKERGNVKGCEIAKLKFKNHIFEKDGLGIEIVGIEPIDGGVQIFAKAQREGKQLGFGKDGSVEIERFRIFNPPVLVDDPNGDIVRERTDFITKEVKQRKLKEDPAEAIRQSLAHTIGLVGKEDTKIVIGKIGNTTDTFYPAAGANSPVDGRIFKSDASWSTLRSSSAGADAAVTPATDYIEADKPSTFTLNRIFILFNTASIPDTDNIDSAILSWMTTGAAAGSMSIGVVQSSPASNDNLVLEDYDQCGALNGATEGATRISSFTTNVYSDWTLNATGLTWIDKTGTTKFGLRTARDLDNSEPPAGDSNREFYMADQTGTASDPKLVVEHLATATEDSGATMIIGDIVKAILPNKVFAYGF